MTLFRSLALTAIAAATIAGGSSLVPSAAQAQIYFGDPRPPIVDYDRENRREAWRARREIERRDAYERAAVMRAVTNGARSAAAPCGAKPTAYSAGRLWRIRTYREQRCR